MNPLFLQKILKRGFDIIASLILLVLTGWLFIVLCSVHKFIIRSNSFFIQRRIGFRHVPFNCIKYRTINETTHLNERTIRFLVKYQRFLRKYKIDEIPQLINVLLGEMSLVGPRPLISDDIAKLKAIDKNSWKRQRMKPGMTGLSQITVDERFGKSKSILKQKITNDIWYSENWCLLVDFKIMFFTLVYIFKQKQINDALIK